MRQVNKYVVPEEEVEQNRVGALKRIRSVYEANEKKIGYNILQHVEMTGGRLDVSPYDFFEEAVLERLSARYGGYDERLYRRDRNNKNILNDVNIEEAIDKVLKGYALTPRGESGRRNFLNGLYTKYHGYWAYLKKNFGATDMVDGIPIDAVSYDKTIDGYVVQLPNGKRVYFVKEMGPNGSLRWVMYDYDTDELIIV